LGHPTRDPHGDPIPSPTGEVESIAPHTLLDCSPKDRVLVERISDDDPQLLRFFAGHGIAPGTRLAVTAADDAEEGQNAAVNLVLPSGATLPLDASAAAAVYVSYL
ncbi:MAG: FeoA domain-containing protein, partial [Rothia sp. (in: high G+C Gram-positive bacteria)]|nr:FeoA domain-containing protein [Rothia sp. (in: high G+C Gram-positive bacteria)]